jgi:membrane protein
VAAVAWVLATVGFSFYANSIGDFNATYGALGGFIVLLLWFFMSGFVVLLGAELNAELEHADIH